MKLLDIFKYLNILNEILTGLALVGIGAYSNVIRGIKYKGVNYKLTFTIERE